MSKHARTSAPKPGTGTWAARRLPPWKFWLIGSAIVLADIAGSVLLMQAGYEITALVWAVLCSLVMLAGAAEYIPLAIIGIVIACGAGIVTSGADVPIFGTSARDVPVASAAGVHATFLHFRDGRVLAEMAEPVDIRGGTQRQGSRVLYTLHVAPVVGDGWTRDQAVTVFAVTGHPGRNQGRDQWAQPWRAGFRINGNNAEEIHAGIAKIALHSGVIVAGNAAIIRWTANPEADAAVARLQLAMAALIALLIWTLATVVLLLVARYRARGQRH